MGKTFDHFLIVCLNHVAHAYVFISQEADSDDGLTCGDPSSDLSINHHPQRKGNYHVIEDAAESSDEEEETRSMRIWPWIVAGVNLTEECTRHNENCFAKTNPQELSDISIL